MVAVILWGGPTECWEGGVIGRLTFHCLYFSILFTKNVNMHVTGPQSKSSYFLARDVEGLLMEQGHELVLLSGVSQLKNMVYLSECEFFPDIRPGVGLLGHMETLCGFKGRKGGGGQTGVWGWQMPSIIYRRKKQQVLL